MQKNIQRFLLTIIFVFCSLFSFSQGTVRGFVYDKQTGEPIMFTNVVVRGTTLGATTDLNGFFTITKVPEGSYRLVSSYLGYDTASVSILVKNEGIYNQKLYLNKSSIQLGTVEISAEKEQATNKVQVSVETVTAKGINKIVAVGGQADLVQYMQTLPGVVFTGDQGGQLYIRGGSPIQNKVMIDGMILYNPFHSIGLFSVFETDIIRNAEISTGGFNAQNGGRLSAVMDITTKDGNQRRLSGKASSSPFLSKIILEGPLGGKKTSDNRPTFVLTAKTSYLEQSSKIFYPYANEGKGLPFNFTDIYAKTSFKSDNGSKISFFGFNFRDQVRFSNVAQIGWNSFGVGTNFVVVPAASTTLIKGNFAYSTYLIQQKEADGKPRQSSINGFNGGLTFNYFLAKDEINYGFEILGFDTDYQFLNQANLFVQQAQSTTELAGFLKYKKIFNKLIIEPGLRLHYYASLATLSPEPRLGLKWNVSNRFRLKAAAGLYSQNLFSAASDRDVVNLFYGFLSGPDNLQKKFNGKDVNTKIQKSQHAILGMEIDLGKYLELNVEAYYKNFSQLININRDKLYEDNIQNAAIPDFQKRDFIIENGYARGIDFRLKYDYKQWYFWGTYSLMYTNRFDDVRNYRPVFDRRHNVNIVATYNFGKTKDWEFSTRWNYGSGFPFTQTQGFYEQINFNDIGTDYTQQNGQLGVQYGPINTGRLPDYHRLDLSLKKTFYLSSNTSLDFNLSASNAYNRQNIFYFDRISFKRVNQLPILPSLAISLNF